MMKESRYNISYSLDNKHIIYNSLSKSSIAVPDDFSINSVLKSNDDNALAMLKKAGIVVDESFDELSALQYIFNKNYFGGHHFLNIVLVPSLACNFSCPYCFEHETQDLFEVNMDRYFQILRLFTDKYFPLYDNIEISLFGGEPLLFKAQFADYLNYVSKHFSHKKYITSIVTNGSLLDIETTQWLILNRCKAIQITIDGNKDIHNNNRIFKNGDASYNLLIDNINNLLPLLDNSCQFDLRINLNNITPEEVASTLCDINIKYRDKVKVLFRPIYNTATYKQNNSNKFYDLKPYYDLAIKLGFQIIKNTYYFQACESCSGEGFFFLMPDLSIWKCVNDLRFSDAKIGYISESGDIRFHTHNLVKWFDYSNCFADEKCLDCKLLPDCFGGCVLYKAKNGTRFCKEFEMSSLPYLY